MKGRDYSGNLVVDGRRILKFISNWDVRFWTGFNWLR
jgi:hypothetical protein